MNASATTSVTATLVAEAERLDFLPAHFGCHFLQVERAVYAWMSELCATYRGGYWEFLSLSNGGGYLRTSEGEWQISVENGFSRTLSADAAGIVVTLFALSHLSFRFPESQLGEQYHRLREFVSAHPEGALIFRAID